MEHESNPLPKYHYCTVCFTQVYNRDLPTRRIRDYDNLELKYILDAIAIFLMVDDSGLYCDVYHTTAFGEKDCTCVSIMDKSRLAEWLTDSKRE